MSSSPPWDRHANIIEIGPRDGRLGSALVRSGYDNYLAVLASASQAREWHERYPELRRATAVADRRRSLRRNNADVLVLNGAAKLSIGYWRAIRHAEWIATPATFDPLTVGAWAAGAVRQLQRSVEGPRIVAVEGASRPLLVWRNRRQRRASARYYIPHRFGAEKFLRTLLAKEAPHAVLRWFESLPEVKPGEDIDLLIDDEQLALVRQLLASGPGLQPIDVYTVTGLPGTDFRSLPYYPPRLAREILETARDHRGVCRAPDAERHFLSLAYHAVYHKGVASGLAADGHAGDRRRADHDYGDILRELGSAVGYEGPLTLDALDSYMASRGWQPSHDMMARLASHNAWLRSKLGSESSAEDDGLAVFLLREQGMSRGGVERTATFLQQRGFRIVHAEEMSPSVAATAAAAIRGGNWGRGPWPASGGPPRAIVVAFDPSPIKPTRRQRKKYPFAVNARVFCKDALRDEFNRGVSEAERCNVIHSSDNGREAWEYLQTIFAGREDEVAAIVERLKQPAASREVVADITKSGRRARVEVVCHEGRLVVKKTFKPEMRRYLDREVAFLSEMQGRSRYVPPLVARGEAWLMIPYYDDVLRYRRSSGRLLPVSVAREAIGALRDVFDAGYALIDASIDNLLVDRREGLKLFDFEFAYRYETRPATFERGYDIAGCPAGFAGDLPIQGGNSYARNWLPYIGLSLEDLMNASQRRQRLLRAAYVARHGHRFAPRRVRAGFRSLWGRDERPELLPAEQPKLPAAETPAPRRAA